MIEISLIAAMDRNRLIGDGLKLPWDLADMPNDMKRLIDYTMSRTLIVGSRTRVGLPKAGLTDRRLIVWDREKCPPEMALWLAIAEETKHNPEAPGVFVIGGAKTFSLFRKVATRLILTRIDHEFQAENPVCMPEKVLQAFEPLHPHPLFKLRAGDRYRAAYSVLNRVEQSPADPDSEKDEACESSNRASRPSSKSLEGVAPNATP